LNEPLGFVESLRIPWRSLEVIVCRCVDGREVPLAELPLERQFTSPETVRSEEILLSVPGGRTVRMRIIATPIEAEGPVPGSRTVSHCRSTVSRRTPPRGRAAASSGRLLRGHQPDPPPRTRPQRRARLGGLPVVPEWLQSSHQRAVRHRRAAAGTR